jgi:hypothetical protein
MVPLGKIGKNANNETDIALKNLMLSFIEKMDLIF